MNFETGVKITFINVGQGECTLIHSPAGNILVDCGPASTGYNAGEKIISPYLKRNGIDKIDILILTHNHNDHAGGVAYILKNFKVKNILTNFDDYGTYFENIVTDKKINFNKIKCGDIIRMDNLILYVLYPFISEKNGSPLAIKMKYKDSEILFSSDISKDEEINIAESYGDFLKSDILKVPHHGSRNSSSPEFLVRCKPSYSVISCGLNNSFNHPSPVTLEKLKALNSTVFRTDLDGAVIFECDGKSIKFQNQ
jgi:competence protein ComEC